MQNTEAAVVKKSGITTKELVIDAMLIAGFQRNSIEKALSGLNGAFDVISAHEAEGIYRKF